MKYFSVQICDSENGDECQHDELDTFLAFETYGIFNLEDLAFCEDCGTEIIDSYIGEISQYPPITNVDELNAIKEQEKSMSNGNIPYLTVSWTGYDKVKNIIYYTYDTAVKLYKDLESDGWIA